MSARSKFVVVLYTAELVDHTDGQGHRRYEDRERRDKTAEGYIPRLGESEVVVRKCK